MEFLGGLFVGGFSGVRSPEEGFRLLGLFVKAFDLFGLGFGFESMGVTELLDTFFLTCTRTREK